MSSVLTIMHVHVHTSVQVLVEEVEEQWNKELQQVLLMGSIITNRNCFVNPLTSSPNSTL